MTDARRGEPATQRVLRSLTGPGRPAPKVRLVLGAILLLAINIGVGAYAYDQQRQLGRYAIGIHDRSFIAMTYVDDARMAFARALAAEAAPTAGATSPHGLTEVVDYLDVVIDRAGSDDARARAADLRAELERLRRLPETPGRQGLISQIHADFAALVRRTARDGLDARDQVEAFARQGGQFLLLSSAVGAGLVVLLSILLGRGSLAQPHSAGRTPQAARFDDLTELLTRSAFRESLQMAVARAERGEEFAILCMDLDRFKQVNETFGRAVGDALLCAVAGRLRGLVREIDSVARLGGNQFAILQIPLGSPDNAALLAERVVQTLRDPFGVHGHRLVIGATVGVALGHAATHDADVLLRHAEMALHRAKQEDRGGFRFFEPEMDARAQQRRVLETELREAIDRDAFELHFMPSISVQRREITSFEALIRWRHPTRGLLGPSDFLALAEETGLMVPIGAWVLRTACREAAGWPDSVRVAVNLSATQFVLANAVEQVMTALRESRLPPERLEVEITEEVLLNDGRRTFEALQALRKIGVAIALDDFGTGTSSLSLLRSFSFDRLKVDNSLVRDLGTADDSAAFVRSIAAIGSALGVKTTAEGVESEQQMRELVADGFDELQGHFFSKPSPAGEVAELLRSGTARQVA
jgi:diguanylate cyclase (GGDEF)-like protein